MKKALTEATAAELRDYASINLGLDIPMKANAPTIISRMRAAGFDADEIETDEPDVVEVVSGPKVAADDSGDFSKMIEIMIPASNDQSGDQYEFVSVGSRDIRIKRGVRVKVPAPFVEVLRNAERFIYDRDQNNMIVGEPRTVPAIPFQIYG